MSGVRLSFALGSWKRLGDVYPPAKQALLDMRNRTAQKFKDGHVNPLLFFDIVALNDALGENTETVRLFRDIDSTNASLAARCWVAAKDEIIAEKQYDLAKKYLKAPVRDYDRIKASYEYDMSDLLDDPAHVDGPDERQRIENKFVEKCLKLIEVTCAIGNMDAAREIRKRAVGVVDDPRLRETAILEKGTPTASEGPHTDEKDSHK
jgi:hypothetical protein